MTGIVLRGNGVRGDEFAQKQRCASAARAERAVRCARCGRGSFVKARVGRIVATGMHV